jgi:hypothetical protein
MELGIRLSFVKTSEFRGGGVEPPPPAVRHWWYGHQQAAAQLHRTDSISADASPVQTMNTTTIGSKMMQ